MKKQDCKLTYTSPNKYVYYINGLDGDQMQCIYYDEQDTWYIYGKDFKGKRIDIDTFNNKDFKEIIRVIELGMYKSDFFKLISIVGKEGHYRYYNKGIRKICNHFYPDSKKLPDVIEYTITIGKEK